MGPDELNVVAKRALDAAFRVHSVLGPGLLESAYCACLAHELKVDGLRAMIEVPVPVVCTRAPDWRTSGTGSTSLWKLSWLSK